MTQTTLFAETIPAAPDGAKLRDEGMKKAEESAERKEFGWSDKAMIYVEKYCRMFDEFTGESVRIYAEAMGIPEPPHKRAWGAIMLKAAKRGLIRKIGTQSVSNPKAHCAIATLWKANRRAL